jgi:hypothetical protein
MRLRTTLAAVSVTTASLAALVVSRREPGVAPPPMPASSAPNDPADVEPPVPPPTATPTSGAAAPGPRSRKKGMDLTFLVTGDTHVGFWEKIPIPGKPEGVPLDDVHRIAIDAMNGLPGTPFPPAIGGRVGVPRGLLVAGDLTEMGAPHEWARFETIFGLTGKEGWVRYPVFEGAGNHDVGDEVRGDTYVEKRIIERHGNTRYSWDWDGVHLVCLGVAPDALDLAWLRQDLATAGRDVGVVLYFHYPLEGPFSRENWFYERGYHEQLHQALDGYRVLGIFTAHYHATGIYRFREHDAYLVGSAKHSWHSFVVVHVTDTRWTVASYNYDRHAFWWWHDKPIFGAPGREARWVSPSGNLVDRR